MVMVMDAELMQSARAAIAKWDDAPQWLWEAADESMDGLDSAMDSLRQTVAKREKEEWLAAMPSELSCLPTWLLRRPDISERARVAVAEDGRLVVTDCHYLLATDPELAERPEVDAPDIPANDLTRILRVPDEHRRVTIAVPGRLAQAVGLARREKRRLLVGDTLLDADLLAAWLLPVLQCTKGDSIEVAYGEPLSKVYWIGDSWAVVGMPLSDIEDARETALDLLEAS